MVNEKHISMVSQSDKPYDTLKLYYCNYMLCTLWVWFGLLLWVIPFM